MGLRRVTERMKEMIGRGGTKPPQEDAMERKDVGTSNDSLTDKAEDTASATKDRAPGGERPTAG